jgi:hypothetical protein
MGSRRPGEHMRLRSRGSRARGSALVEFVLCCIVWVPLLLGTIFIGINVARSIEVTQICRDSGHMYAYGVDFSQAGNQAILVQLATGFYITPTAGNGVFILSTVMLIGPQQCQAGGLQPDSGSCPNLNDVVFTRRIVVGNQSLRASNYGTPNRAYISSNGSISSTGYLTDGTMRVPAFPSSLNMTAGQSAYVSEAYFSAPDLNWNTFTTNQGVYSSFIF